jgi:hypothetical protein
MAAPVWATQAGFLGTFTQQIQFVATGSNITLALKTDVPDATFSIIGGNLPGGLHIYEGNGIIYGTPYYTNQLVTSEFVVRATNSSGVADRTFSMDIAGPTAPVWVTSKGLLPVGPNLEYYVLNLNRIHYQLNATTPKLPNGQSMRYYIKPNAGRLPPGVSLNQSGLLSGVVNDVLTLDYLASIQGGYDEEFYDSAPYDHVVIIKNVSQGRPEAIAKIYSFTVVATDGVSSSEQTFLLRVEDPNALRADNVELYDKTVTVQVTLGANVLTVTSNTSTTMPSVGSVIFGPINPDTFAPTVILDNPATYVKSIDFNNKTFTINSTALSNYTGPLFYRAQLLNQQVGQNTALSGDSALFKADVGALEAPNWIDSNGVDLPTVANLGTFRSNNYQIIPLSTYDPYPYKGAVTYDWLSRVFNPEIRLVTDSAYNAAGIPTANLLGQSQLTVKEWTSVPSIGMQFKLDGYVKNADNKIYTIAGITKNTNGTYTFDLGVYKTYIKDLQSNVTTPSIGYNTTINLPPTINASAVGAEGSEELTVNNILSLTVGMTVTGPGVQDYTKISTINSQRRTATLTKPLLSDVDNSLVFGPALGDTYQYKNTISNSTHYCVYTDNGWIDYAEDPGYIISGTGVIKLSTKILDTTNVYCGSRAVKPAGLTLDTTTGSLSGVLPYQPSYSQTYKFTVRVNKKDYTTGDVVFKDQMFNLTLQGQVQTQIEFVSTSSLGTIIPGQRSDLAVVAKHTNDSNLSINYTYSPVGTKTTQQLPSGIILQRDGSLVGRVPYGKLTTIDLGAVGFKKFSLDQDTTTLDTNFSFNVTANDVYLLSSVTKQFNVTLNEYTPTFYTGIYFKPLMSVDNRKYYKSLIQNYNVFSSDLLYRPDDPAFGVQGSIKMYLEYGLQELNLDYYIPGLVNYFKRKRFYFGDITSAVAQDDSGNPIYEVIYVKIIDDQMDGNNSPSSFTETINGTVVTFYPDSVSNMQTAIESIPIATNASGVISVDNSFRPKFMKTIQTSTGTPLGFVKAAILCYALPGKAADIISRINTLNFDFKQLDFDVDRLYIEQSLTTTSTSYLLFGTGASSSGFNISTEDGIQDPADVNYNLQYIQFIAGQDITTEDGVVLTI